MRNTVVKLSPQQQKLYNLMKQGRIVYASTYTPPPSRRMMSLKETTSYWIDQDHEVVSKATVDALLKRGLIVRVPHPRMLKFIVKGKDMENVVHPVEDFHKFPFASLDPARYVHDWQMTGGGYSGIPGDAMVIKIVEKVTLKADFWVVPKCLQAMIEQELDAREKGLQRDLRKLLGVE